MGAEPATAVRNRLAATGPSRSAGLALRVLLAGIVVASMLVARAGTAAAEPTRQAIAAANGRTGAEIDRILADPTARVGAGNRLYYVDPGPASQPGSAKAATPTPAAPFPYDQTFLLHSRPGSSRVVYLDFDGQTVAGTAWNSSPELGTPASFYAQPFSIDGSAAFTNAEKDVIQSVWQRVSEDYAPFDVDITTADPGTAAINRAGPADQMYGTRAVITNTNTIYDACGCGGIAYIDVFDESSLHAEFQPAFVFNLSQEGDPKFIAEATSHEVGHNLNLDHDGESPGNPDYYGGHGAWGPIMGASYLRPITQWSKGEYSAASNLQDDLAVIAANGAPLLPDDHGNTAATATVLTAGPAIGASGIITTDGDVDAFRIRAGAGAATFSVSPAANSPNLDILLELRTEAGALVVASNPPSAAVTYDQASGLAASVSTTLPSTGTYRLLVSGVGTGDPTTGYSGYGSIGRYALTGAAPVPPATVPEAPTITSTLPGDGQVTVTWAAPAFDGGSAITGYRLTAAPGGATSAVGAATLVATVTGLTNGTSYSLRVVAINAVGDSPSSASSTAVPRAFAALPAPARLLDTRNSPTIDGQFSNTGPLPAGATLQLPVAGRAGIPTNAPAATTNVTVVNPTGPGFITVFPCGQARPNASNLNYTTGDTIPNAVITSIGTAGTICLYTSATTHLILDASGTLT